MESKLFFFRTLSDKETWMKIYEVLSLIYEKNELNVPYMDEELDISTYYFTFFYLDPNDISEGYYEFLEEETQIKANYRIYVQFMNQRIDEGMPIFFQVIGELLKVFGGDMILLENGEFPVFERLNGEVFISGHYREYQKELYSKETLSYLGVPYTEKEDLDLL